LRDWAFRKAPPLECGVKRFGVAQPDHELCWLDYEGEIRSGHGAGVLRIWDKGTYQLLRNEETPLLNCTFMEPNCSESTF
jgi:hypothetical protein